MTRDQGKSTRELANEGLSQRAIAEKVGVSKRTVKRYWNRSHESSLDTKTESPPRQRIQVNLSNYTKPATAIPKLIDKFGAEWCRQLAIGLLAALEDR